MLPYKKTKTWSIKSSGTITPVTRNQTNVPRIHRSVDTLCKHNRTTRVGDKPDIGNPGKPEGW